MRTLLFLIAFLASGLLFAQNEITAIHAMGKALYYAPGQSAGQEVYPGMRMALDGKVRCFSGGSVKLLYNGETFSFSDGKMRPLRELEQLSKSRANAGFLGRFWNFLSGSMKQTQDEKTLEENHRRYMESVYAGVRGYAVKVYPIQTSLMFGSNLSDVPVTFRWSGAAGEQPAHFQIKRKSDDLVLFSAAVRGNACTADLSQLAIEPGSACTWQLVADEDTTGGTLSRPAEFLYDPQGAAQALASLLPDPDYQHAFPVEQLLMQAYVLEKAGFYYDAAQKYAAAAAGYPRNALVRDARAAFLARMDMLEEAKTVMRN